MKVTVCYEDDGRKSPWFVRWYVKRLPRRRFFATRAEAESFAADVRERIRKGSDPEDVDRALRMLAGTGIAVSVVVKAGLDAMRSKSSDADIAMMTIDEAARRILSRAIEVNLRKKTIASYRGHFAMQKSHYGGERVLATISDAEVRQHLGNLPDRNGKFGEAAFATKECVLRTLRMLGKEAGIAKPFPSVVLPREEIHSPGYLTPAEVRLLFQHAYIEERGMLALALFGAVRPTRFKEWSPSQIHIAERRVRIPGPLAKCRQPAKLQTNPGNSNNPGPHPVLFAWLAAYPFEPRSWPHFQCRMSRLLGHWPHDACRHTGATYFAALYGVTPTAELLTHNDGGKMVRQHYDGLATKEEAEEFFSITPESIGRGESRGLYYRAKIIIPVPEMLDLLDRLSMKEIGAQLGTSGATVAAYMRRHGIPTPGRGGDLRECVAAYRTKMNSSK